ncbi:hypothetical protein Btru_037407 [Bulinus truncatus]|nr:hypothetical protein Btru_037407 [Bulinus truncatus]
MIEASMIEANMIEASMIEASMIEASMIEAILSLSTCGQMGRQGPTQEMCDHHYDLQSSVRVSEDGNFAGAQIWTVPKSSIYRFEVFGSRGGMAVDDQKQHKDILGTLVETKLYFEKGESIFFAVGQQGDDACPMLNDSRPLALIVAGGGKGQRITEYVTEGETAQAGDNVYLFLRSHHYPKAANL